MRVMFTGWPDYGNLLPVIGLAQTVREAGHDVIVSTPPYLRAGVERTGLAWVAAGPGHDDPEFAPLRARQRALTGADRGRFALLNLFGSAWPRLLVPELLDLASTWHPDLLVHDSMEFGVPIASRLLRIPHATLEVHAAGEAEQFFSPMDQPLQALQASHGLSELTAAEMRHEYLLLTPFPPTLYTAVGPASPPTQYVRLLPPDDRALTLPNWLSETRSRPLLYLSLGTSFNSSDGADLFAKLLAGLTTLDVEIVLTVGNDVDPAILGSQPDRVHAERYLPLQALLPHCALAITHGGSGTTALAVAAGLPMVILPVGADQFLNAEACARVGISRTLDRADLRPVLIAEIVRDVLTTPGYRETAARLQAEFNALPGPGHAVELLERLAREKAPIVATR
jgi:UDP:flavonoid glycosyltransferase YjiC (YdhE family)